MSFRSRSILLSALCCILSLFLPTIELSQHSGGLTWRLSQAVAEPAGSVSEAFASAKELGTLEAWEAFLTNYPTGFHADLARAYVNELGKGTPAPTAAPAPAVAPAPTPVIDFPPADELPCQRASRLSSESSSTPAKLVFINSSGASRSIVWIDFKGGTKEYARLANGEQLTQDTYLTHPWMAMDEAGNCSQVFMPGPGTTVALLEVEDGRDEPSRPRKKQSRAEEDRGPTRESQCLKTGGKWRKGRCAYTQKATPAQSCAELGMAYRNGQCVAKAKADIQRLKKQKKIGCPAGTYLNPLGVCQPNETGG